MTKKKKEEVQESIEKTLWKAPINCEKTSMRQNTKM